MRRVVVLIFGLTVLFVWWSLLASQSVATVRFFDIGQGDAAMISSGRTQLLVDGGPDRSVLNGIGEAMPMLDRRIEYVVLSHPHADHYRGLVDVLKRYEIGTLIVGVPGEEAEYLALIENATRQGVSIVRAAGQTIDLSDSTRFEIAMPKEPWPDEPVEHPNDSSVIGIATIERTRILFTGDAETKEEAQLVRSGVNLDADILKVGHHGSRTSSTPRLLEMVSPSISVISVGKDNRYGHPTPVTMQSLTNAGSRILRTDERGTITVTFANGEYRVETER